MIEALASKPHENLNYSELTKQYTQLRDFTKILLISVKSTSQKLKEKEETLAKNSDFKKKEGENTNKEITKLKAKIVELQSENNFFRKKKHTIINESPQASTELIVNESEIQYKEPIGEGASSIVNKAIYKGIVVAVKKINMEGDNSTSSLVIQ